MDKIVRIFFSIFITFIISLILAGVFIALSTLSLSQQPEGAFGVLALVLVGGPAMIIFLMAILTPFVYRKITNPSEVKLKLPELYNRGGLKRILIYLLIGLAIFIYLFSHQVLRIF